jgi:hypothetical protein
MDNALSHLPRDRTIQESRNTGSVRLHHRNKVIAQETHNMVFHPHQLLPVRNRHMGIILTQVNFSTIPYTQNPDFPKTE